MHCPKCNCENNDSAKFCKKCGTPLKKTVTNINTVNNESSKSDTTKYIIIALVIIVIALAGAFAYIGFTSHNNDPIQNNANILNPGQTTSQSSSSSSSGSSNSAPMTILGGSFSTGSGLSDKTYASINVGSEHAGKSAIIQIKYSRDGSSLNNGNMVPVTVDSSGYIEVSSADAYKYYPDYAEINLFDTNNNLLDTKSVSLSPDSSTQSF